MEHHLVLRVVARTLIPLIMLFALYVQFHGDYGPGGGFQAGVIFAVAFILYGLIYGVDKLRDVVHPGLIRSLAAFGVLLYLGVGKDSLMSVEGPHSSDFSNTRENIVPHKYSKSSLRKCKRSI